MPPSHAIVSSTGQSHGLVSALRQQRVFGAWAVRGQLKKNLEELDIRRSPTSDAPVWILVTLLAVAAGSATIGAITGTLDAQTAVGLAAAVLTVAGLLVAVLQWRHGLSEKAFDALYARIKMANDMRLEVFKDMKSDDESEVAGQHPERYRFFVYTEIDSLEYAARRYGFGLGMSADIVTRAVAHFESRCIRSELFCRTAEDCTGELDAYFPETKTLVHSIVVQARLRRTDSLP
jgi:hypothetical protein